MKNFKLKASVLAVSLAMSGAAFAVVDLDNNTTPGTVTFASELVTSPQSISGANVDVAHVLGFGVSNSQTRFLRYDLTNATFASAVTSADLVISGGTTVAVSSGGQAGTSSVIFQITAVGDLAQGQAVSFGVGSDLPAPAIDASGIVVANASAPASIQYRLYETATAAVAAGTPLASSDALLASFATGLAFTTITNNSTASVSKFYKEFIATIAGTPATTATLTSIGKVSFGVAAGVVHPNPLLTLDLTHLVAAGTKLVVTGQDLSAAGTVTPPSSGVFLSSDNTTCTDDGAIADTKTGNVVDFVTGTTAITRNVCFQANGSPITAQSFTIGVDVVPATGSTTGDLAAKTLGTFDRDGTVLKVPFSQGTAGQTTFVNLANMGNVDAPFTTRCFTGPGTGAPTAGVAGTVLAGNTKKLKSADLLCAAGTNAVEFTLAVPTGNVVGTFVRQNNTTGDSGMSDVTGNQ